jgi:hypothetical protein
VFEFAEIVAAHQLMESGEERGKIVARSPEGAEGASRRGLAGAASSYRDVAA